MSSVKPVPDGYHTVTPYMIVRDAAKAIEFYKKAFGAQEIARMPTPSGLIMHAEIRIGNSVVMMGDERPESESKSPQTMGGTPISFYIYLENVDQAWKRALDAGANVKMPLADMFWGDRMGTLDDPFGHRWSIAQHIGNPSHEEMKKGQEAFRVQMKQKKETLK